MKKIKTLFIIIVTHISLVIFSVLHLYLYIRMLSFQRPCVQFSQNFHIPGVHNYPAIHVLKMHDISCQNYFELLLKLISATVFVYCCRNSFTD